MPPPIVGRPSPVPSPSVPSGAPTPRDLKEAAVLRRVKGPEGMYQTAAAMFPKLFESLAFEDGPEGRRRAVLVVHAPPTELEPFRQALERSMSPVGEFPLVLRRSRAYLEAWIQQLEPQIKKLAPQYFEARAMPDGAIDLRFDPQQPKVSPTTFRQIQRLVQSDGAPLIDVWFHD